MLGDLGLRTRVEGAALRWDQVDLDAEPFGWVVIGATKTEAGEHRAVPLTPRLRDALRAWEREHRRCGEYVFHHEVTRRLFNGTKVEAGAPLGKVTLGRRLKAVAVKLGIPGEWVPYDLRHRCITAWAKNSIALAQVAAGHSDIRMTQWYTHLKKDRRAIAALVAGR